MRVLPLLAAPAAGLQAKAWRGDAHEQPHWPELDLPEIASRPSTAVCFSGGGTRAMVAALAQMKALQELDLIKNTRYISGISGGSWATSIIAYTPGNPVDDSVLFGDIVEPDQLTMEGLGDIPEGCARSAATKDFPGTTLKYLLETADVAQAIRKAVGELYLAPFGVNSTGFATWSPATREEIVSRNPELADASFAYVREGRPYPVIGLSLLGPAEMMPFDLKRRAYKMAEATPLYTGLSAASNITYTKRHFLGTTTKNNTIGGQVEPWAFASPAGASTPLPAGAKAGQITVGAPGSFHISAVSGASSWAPGGALASITALTQDLGMQMPYWPVLRAGEGAEGPGPGGAPDVFLIGDGGIVDNFNLISMLQRKVENIVLFINTEVPLVNRTVWDPTTRDPGYSDLDDDIPAFFGIEVWKDTQPGYYYMKNTVFNTSDFPAVAAALQDSAAAGTGAIATTKLTTVENQWYGIEAGFEASITWVYLSRVCSWEAKLAAEVRGQAVSSSDPGCLDPSARPVKGVFKNFPNFDTGSQLQMDPEQANLLGSMAGWAVKANAEIYRAALAPNVEVVV
mmetsp:Transcript_22682/g.49684  ORF Transcript_22682/g.49684 Transcript_22682/m.49684 type:complete len:571 (-) Transcript_22682:35-1747(-)